MEARELRIGNFVSFDSEIHTIIGVSETYPFLNTIKYGIGLVEYRDLQPIPLTEQWLMDLGFYKGFGGEPRIEVNSEIAMSLLNGITYIGDDLIIKHIKYVHQLQNLYFALTGQELDHKLSTTK